MPTGVPYQGHIPPYPSIRVDAFSTPKEPYHTTHLHLLTHTHSDHITGLDSPSFGQPVVCSYDAKHMLLRAEKSTDRINFDRGLISEEIRPWAHLKTVSKKRGERALTRDLLRPISLCRPEYYQLDGNERVRITAIDANHCPGSVMYLIEGSQGAVLHTGDMRAEHPFVEALKRNPFLAPYLAPEPGLDFRSMPQFSAIQQSQSPFKPLEAIYLDTACLVGTTDLPSKSVAVSGLVQLMSLFPPVTRFFINIWTWGYEDIMKAVARSFGCLIHVDRYKKNIYSFLESDPLLGSIVTSDPQTTRFHACERFNRCHCVSVDDPNVVYVNAVECSKATWEDWLKMTRQKLSRGESIRSLIVPLARHSTLPELQRFVSIFRPKRVVPNTVLPKYHGADWACIPIAFASVMAPGGPERVKDDMRGNGFSQWTDGPLSITPMGNRTLPLHIFMSIEEASVAIGLHTSTWENFEAPERAASEAAAFLRGTNGRHVRDEPCDDRRSSCKGTSQEDGKQDIMRRFLTITRLDGSSQVSGGSTPPRRRGSFDEVDAVISITGTPSESSRMIQDHGIIGSPHNIPLEILMKRMPSLAGSDVENHLPPATAPTLENVPLLEDVLRRPRKRVRSARPSPQRKEHHKLQNMVSANVSYPPIAAGLVLSPRPLPQSQAPSFIREILPTGHAPRANSASSSSFLSERSSAKHKNEGGVVGEAVVYIPHQPGTSKSATQTWTIPEGRTSPPSPETAIRLDSDTIEKNSEVFHVDHEQTSCKSLSRTPSRQSFTESTVAPSSLREGSNSTLESSNRRHRKKLLELIQKCDRARSATPLADRPFAAISGTVSVSPLALTDNSPGSMDLQLMGRMMDNVRQGRTLPLKCLESP